MPSPASTYALVLAGGSGSRFWPLSRNARPKQLLRLFGERTLLESTVDRLDGLVPPERVLVLTNESQLDAVRAALPGLPPANILAEPARRDTAPAIALAAGWIAARDPEATMIVLPADHLVTDAEAFRSVLAAAVATARREGALVTLGIKPDWPCPGFGYIERGELVEPPAQEGASVHEVLRFREKPGVEEARRYLEQGNFSWNAGIFVWTLPAFLRELSAQCPELAEFAGALRDAPDFDAAVAERFPSLTRISIDFALMEKAGRILCIEADVGWDDVGGWPSVAKHLEADGQGNRRRGALVSVDARDNIVFCEGEGTTVSLLGVENLIVVKTGDAVLVADRSQADRIKELVDRLPPELL